jgi:hypothetical protein
MKIAADWVALRKLCGTNMDHLADHNVPTPLTDCQISCPTCGACDLGIKSTAADHVPVRCGRCGDYIGSVGALRQAMTQHRPKALRQ